MSFEDAALRDDVAAERAREPRPKAEQAGAVAGESKDDRLVGPARDRLATVVHAAHAIADLGHRRLEVELALVVAGHVAVLEDDFEVGHGQVGLGVGPHHLLRQLVRLDVLPVFHELADLGQHRPWPSGCPNPWGPPTRGCLR